MRAIIDLEHLGYQFNLEGDRIRYVRGAGAALQADAQLAKKLLAKIAEDHVEAVAFLRSRDGAGRPETLSEQTHGVQGLSEQSHTSPADDPAAAWASVFGEPGAADDALGLLEQPQNAEPAPPPGRRQLSPLEAELSALIDSWQAEPDRQRDASFARRYAELAIALDFPFIGDDGETDLGVAGWREWVETF